MAKTIRLPRTFVPSEAHAIAASFRSQAAHIRDLARQLRDVKGSLDISWEGNSKNIFSSDFAPEPGNMDCYAAWLEDRARAIECMTVTIWETITVP